MKRVLRLFPRENPAILENKLFVRFRPSSVRPQPAKLTVYGVRKDSGVIEKFIAVKFRAVPTEPGNEGFSHNAVFTPVLCPKENSCRTNKQTNNKNSSITEGSTSAMFHTEKKTLTVYQASGLKYFICFVSNSVNRHSGCSLFIFVFFCVIQCQVTQFHFGCFSEATSYGYLPKI